MHSIKVWQNQSLGFSYRLAPHFLWQVLRGRESRLHYRERRRLYSLNIIYLSVRVTARCRQ